MINNLPLHVTVVFILTTLLTLFFLYKASGNSNKVIAILGGWLLLQAFISYSLFYTVTLTLPPRFLLLIGPPLLLILFLFLSKSGKKFIDTFNIKLLTYLHVVRVPVEFVLYWLFIYGYAPELMTFEGRNFDILSGLSAPVIAYLAFTRKTTKPVFIILWNIICLALLFNIVFHGILSVESPFQQFAFEQPNLGLMYFPFTLLPGFIVPAVLFSHLASIRLLLNKQS